MDHWLFAWTWAFGVSRLGGSIFQYVLFDKEDSVLEVRIPVLEEGFDA